ncbi:deoxyribose-phosphate aldolase [Falsirhodobacter halotolerans]|uniref:deoxyribose-phosphate aldolase n=1 Tax=Falsirhodobacter halotolerans TaxID=1146892 RepID=UPI001FD42D2E|nr:deoxyribose-phosphate aldolase [Falsirhodobacter halotolerans]MCJ8141180.1 deoxyribose-phosphate aldolase [Falsirhodobacter halotolerans]
MTVPPATIARIVGVIDLTNLSDDTPREAIVALCRKARDRGVAAVCVHVPWVAEARDLLAGSAVRVATVLNFPTGSASVPDVLTEARRAAEAGAQELDLVVPYRQGPDAVKAMVRAVREAHPGLTLKAILETGECREEDHATLARAAIAGGADMLKTSTGMVPVGATPAAAGALLGAIAAADRPVGLKVSGGIRTADAAAGFLAQADAAFGQQVTPALFRIGCSGLLDALEDGSVRDGY